MPHPLEAVSLIRFILSSRSVLLFHFIHILHIFADNRISLKPQIYFFREEPFGDLSPMEAGMKVGLPLTMNNPNKMTDYSISDVKNQT